MNTRRLRKPIVLCACLAIYAGVLFYGPRLDLLAVVLRDSILLTLLLSNVLDSRLGPSTLAFAAAMLCVGGASVFGLTVSAWYWIGYGPDVWPLLAATMVLASISVAVLIGLLLARDLATIGFVGVATVAALAPLPVLVADMYQVYQGQSILGDWMMSALYLYWILSFGVVAVLFRRCARLLRSSAANATRSSPPRSEIAE
jgi:hypothetical protein